MFYRLPFDDIATGTVADTYKTFASLIVGDNAGLRCRIRSLVVDGSDDAPADANVGIKISRIADVSVGSAGTKTAVSAANMAKVDPGGPDSTISGGRDYTAEPTTYETEELFQGGMNIRGGLERYFDADEAPTALQDMLLGLLICPRGTTAYKFSGVIGFEIF